MSKPNTNDKKKKRRQRKLSPDELEKTRDDDVFNLTNSLHNLNTSICNLKKQKYSSLIDDVESCMSTQAEDLTMMSALEKSMDLNHSLQLRKQLLPKKKKDSLFTNPYFFLKRPSANLGTVNWDHFKTGLVIPDVELVAQMKHFDHHLSRTTTEWSWRDSKTARSRSLGRMMS